MNYTKVLSCGLLAMAALVFVESSNAQSIIYQCNGCTEQQYEKIATGLGIGKHRIGDFNRNVLNGYSVSREPNHGGTYTYEVDPLSTSTLQNKAFGAYYEVIYVNHANAIVVNVPTHRPSGYPVTYDSGNAVAWASQPAYYNAINIWLNNLQADTADGPVDWLPTPADAALLAMQTGISVSAFSPSTTFNIQMGDGTIVTFKWDSSGKATEVSVVDPYGNTIPISNQGGTPNINGTYNIPAGNPSYGTALIDYLNSMGALVHVNPTQFPVVIICMGKCSVAQPN